MRIEEEYVKTGYFWLPEQQENKIPGILTIKDGGNIELEVVGLFDESIKALNGEDDLSRIIGHVEKDGLVTLDNCFYTKKNISFGGERLSDKVLNKTRELFPKAKIRNIYASSEAGSVLSSNDIGFYIPTRYETLVRIIDNELCIHKSLLGNFNFDGHWYHTGDYVEYIDDVHFVFDSRKSEIVNTGGYRVSLAKVEKYIQTLRGVSNVVVYGRPNSLVGTIIVAEIVCDDRKTIKENIKNTDILTEYEKPKLIKFVESIKLTSTGKIKRK